MSLEIHYYPLQSLEKSLAHVCFQPVDVRQKIGFPDYLLPNETHPEGIQPLLHRVKQGYCVVTGTERMFFNALLADPKRLFGFIGRDFNPRAKAYNDYVIMLLKICRTRQEFKELSSLPAQLKVEIKENLENKDEEIHPGFQDKLERVKTLLLKARLPEEVKGYYLTHLNDFAEVYYLMGRDRWKNPRDPSFRSVHYHDNDMQWKQLHMYAMRGSLIATVGDIGDLSFLDKHKISVIDVSNIPCYSLIHFQGQTIPHVIWTRKGENKTAYLMGGYTPLSASERGELDTLVATLQESRDLREGDIGGAVGYLIHSRRLIEKDPGEEFLHCYSQETLQWLKSYVTVQRGL